MDEQLTPQLRAIRSIIDEMEQDIASSYMPEEPEVEAAPEVDPLADAEPVDEDELEGLL